MVCFPKRNLYTAMIPLHRRDVHLKKYVYTAMRTYCTFHEADRDSRLLSQGYKVGIVEQTETAALKKASDNRNELFTREVTRLYTAATYDPVLLCVSFALNLSLPALWMT